MSEATNIVKSLRERLSDNTEERLGKALSDLLENPLITGAISRAFDARERASQAQEVAMGALNIPSAADIERLTRRLRAVSHRLEGIEDGVHRLDRALAPGAVEARLSAIEEQLGRLAGKLSGEGPRPARPAAAAAKPTRSRAAKAKPAKAKAKPASKAKAATKAKPAAKRKPAKAKPAAKVAGKAKATKAKATGTAKAGKAKVATKAKAARKTATKAAGKAKAAAKSRVKAASKAKATTARSKAASKAGKAKATKAK